jgi:hypothetical protein
LTTVGVDGEEHANRDSEEEQMEVVLRYVWNFLFQTCTHTHTHTEAGSL